MRSRSARRFRSFVFVAFSLVVSAAVVHAQPAKVTGTIFVDAKKITPQAVSAVGYKAPNGQLISVLVSDKAADRKEFLERTRTGPGEPLVSGIFEGAWKGLHLEKALSGFVFTINTDRRIMSNEFLIGGDEAFSIFDDDLVLELKSTAPRLTGRIRTKDPVLEAGGHKFGLDVTFDVPVGEPGK
jgi:hypothetical protein